MVLQKWRCWSAVSLYRISRQFASSVAFLSGLYCEDEKLEPRHDESNDEIEYTRNKIRNVVLPYIKEEFNPNIINSMDKLSKIAREEKKYIDIETSKVYDKIIIEENNLNIFNKEDIVIRKNLILYSVNKLFGDIKGIEKVHIEDIIKLCNNNIGNKYLTPNKKTKIVIENKKIKIIRLN